MAVWDMCDYVCLVLQRRELAYRLHVSDLAVMILGYKFNSHPVIKES